ncbi:uncharacterized protein Dvar_76690 [Desulfosarcina variabilis str. Montpellier]
MGRIMASDQSDTPMNPMTLFFGTILEIEEFRDQPLRTALLRGKSDPRCFQTGLTLALAGVNPE